VRWVTGWLGGAGLYIGGFPRVVLTLRLVDGVQGGELRMDLRV
jgi:hypothetical protein